MNVNCFYYKIMSFINLPGTTELLFVKLFVFYAKLGINFSYSAVSLHS